MAPSGKGNTVNGNSHYQRSAKEAKAAKKVPPKDDIRERNDNRTEVANPIK